MVRSEAHNLDECAYSVDVISRPAGLLQAGFFTVLRETDFLNVSTVWRGSILFVPCSTLTWMALSHPRTKIIQEQNISKYTDWKADHKCIWYWSGFSKIFLRTHNKKMSYTWSGKIVKVHFENSFTTAFNTFCIRALAWLQPKFGKEVHSNIRKGSTYIAKLAFLKFASKNISVAVFLF